MTRRVGGCYEKAGYISDDWGWVAVMALLAQADFIFNLTGGNSDAIGNFPGPYQTVDVHLNSSTSATVTFTSLTNSGNIYLMGANGAAALNVNAASFSVGSITGSNGGTGFTPGPLS